MRPSAVLHVSVLLLCTSLAYWAGLKQSHSDLATTSTEASRRTTRENQEKPSGSKSSPSEAASVEALAATVRSGNPAKEDPAYDQAWEELIERDPEMAWALLLEKGDRREYYNYSDSILLNLTKKNPHKAHELARGLTNSSQRAAAMAVVLNTWASQAPKEALKTALAHTETRRPQVLSELGRIWGDSAPVEAAAYALSLEQGAMRRGFLQGVSNSWLSQDVQGFCAWFRQLPDRDSRNLASNLSPYFYPDRPGSVGDIVLLWDTLPVGQSRESLVSSLMQPLKIDTKEDFARQLSEIEGLGDSKLNNLLRERLLERYAEDEPTLAAEFLGLAKPGEKMHLLETLATSWARQDPDAAKLWFESLPQGQERQLAANRIVQILAEEQAEDALAFFMAHPEAADGEDGGNVLSSLALSDLDPAKLLEKLPSLVNDSEKRLEVVRDLGSRWAAEDLLGCVESIESLPPGETRDQLVKGLAGVISNEDPTTAMEWVLTVQNPSQREETTRDTLMEWISQSPTEAKAWVEKNRSLLSKETRTFLKNLVKVERDGKSTDGFYPPNPGTDEP